MFTRPLLVAAGLALAAGASFAQGAAHEDERHAAQEQRIQQGEANGTITPREGARLQQQQRQIHRAERGTAADGNVSPAVRTRTERMLNRASRSIERKEDNNRVSN